jgi:hypothetical protein
VKTYLATSQEIRLQIWKELGRASQDRHHAWRTPVLATATPDGSVNARTVVLRGVNLTANEVLVYTDQRSSKVAELAFKPGGMFVFWSERLGWQLRMKVHITTLTTGTEVEERWKRIKESASANDYIHPTAPGSPLASGAEASPALPSTKNHFTVLVAKITEMDWLELASGGHRRARMTSDTWEWLTP